MRPARSASPAWPRAVALLLALAGCACGPARRAERAAPATFAPLPGSAFRIEWAPVRLPTTLRPGESRRVAVSFTNAGPVAWPADGHPRLYCIRLSHRFVRGADGIAEEDYGNHRVELPAPLRPGESVTLADTVVAPTTPGDYVVQFDLVQVGVAWFSSRGAALKLVLVKVQ